MLWVGGVEDAAVLGGAEGPLCSWAGWQRAAAFSSQGRQGLRRGSLKGTNLYWEQWRKVSGWSQGGGLPLGSALPVAASGCLCACCRQVLCRLKPDGQYPGFMVLWSSACGKLHQDKQVKLSAVLGEG